MNEISDQVFAAADVLIDSDREAARINAALAQLEPRDGARVLELELGVLGGALAQVRGGRLLEARHLLRVRRAQLREARIQGARRQVRSSLQGADFLADVASEARTGS